MVKISNWNTPDNIYKEIIKENITLDKGIELLVNLLAENKEESLKIDYKNVLNKLLERPKELFEAFIKILRSNQIISIKLIVAKEIFNRFPEKSIVFLKSQIEKENSATFITYFYRFLRKIHNEISEILQNSIISKYTEMYNVILGEAKFFLDLEATQIEGINGIDFIVGYFKKFETTNIKSVRFNRHFNYVLRDYHIIALDLSSWELKQIPESIDVLSKLEYLNLSNLRVKNLPESIQHLLNLKYLNLSGIRLRKIPKWLKIFAKINFSKKYIDEGVDPFEATILGILEILSGKKLEKVEIQIDVVQWEQALNYKINNEGKVIGLFINDEKIDIGTFPEEICSLEFLEELEISKSSIELISNCIGRLKVLKYLNLSFNRIKSVPNSLIKLKNLEYLDLEHNEISEKTILALTWFKTGKDYLDNHEYNKAIEECNNTLEDYPKNLIAWYHLGIAYNEIGNVDKSIQAFKRYLKIDPVNAFIWGHLSDIYHEIGDYEKAIDGLQHATEIEPKSAILWGNLGVNYKKLGKYDKAIAAYLYSLKINPKNKNVWRDLATIYRDKGEYLKAIEAEEHAIELDLNF